MSHAHHLSNRQSAARTLVRPVALAIVALCAALPHVTAAARENRVLVVNPGPQFGSAYNELSAPVLNERGQVALMGYHRLGAHDGTVNDLLQWGEAKGTSVLAGIGPQFLAVRGSLTQNDQGDVGFVAVSTASAKPGIYLSSRLDAGPLGEVGGFDLSGQYIQSLGAPQLIGNTRLMLFQTKSTTARQQNLWLEGGQASDGQFLIGRPAVYRNMPLNILSVVPRVVVSANNLVVANKQDAVQSVAFSAVVGQSVDGVSFKSPVGAILYNDTVLGEQYWAAADRLATGTGWWFQNLQNAAPALASGRRAYQGAGIAFASQLSKNFDGTGASATGIYRFLSIPRQSRDPVDLGTPTGTLTEVARTGTAAPGGGTHLSFDDKVFINDSLQVAYSGQVSGLPRTGPRSSNARAHGSIFVDRNDIVDEGQLAPTASGASARHFDTLKLAAFNNAGVVLFSSLLKDPGDTRLDQGIFLGDGRELLSVVRTGDALAGAPRKQVATVALSDDAMNSHGQVAYSVKFQDGAIGAFLYTPTLHWRDETGPRGLVFGSWDNATSWTLGLAPAEVHDVKIDPSSRINITGPANDRTVRSLDVGTGAGAVALALQPGVTLSVLEGGLHIGAHGTLTGSGTVQGNVVNDGLIRPTSIAVLDRITNHGRIEGGGHLQGSLANGSTGTVSVAAGEHLTMFGFVGGPSTNRAHQNLGAITVDGGVLTMIGGLGNQGTLHATDASLGFIGRGLLNHGEVRFDGAHVDLSGQVFNASSGHIATGNANAVVFHDSVVNAGALDIGAASSARFLGGLSLTGSSQLSLVLGASALDGAALMSTDGPVGLAGVLSVDFEPGFVVQAGDAFTLFDWSGSSVHGNFGSLALVDLGAALTWDTDELLTSGRLSIAAAVGHAQMNFRMAEPLDVAAVPEPQTWALLLAGLGAMGFVMRRRKV